MLVDIEMSFGEEGELVSDLSDGDGLMFEELGVIVIV